VAVAAALAAAGACLVPGSASAAVGGQPTTRCAVLAQGQSCAFGVSGNPSQPYTATIPAGVSLVTAVVEGGTGANGDFGAAGGAGGVVVATIAVNAGEQLSLWVGDNGNSYNQVGQGWADGGVGFGAGSLGFDSGAGGGASAIEDDSSDTLLTVAGGGGGAGGSYNNIVVGGNGGAGGQPAGDGTQGGSPAGGYFKGGGGPGGPGGANNAPQKTTAIALFLANPPGGRPATCPCRR
jgi:hypothetical protein